MSRSQEKIRGCKSTRIRELDKPSNPFISAIFEISPPLQLEIISNNNLQLKRKSSSQHVSALSPIFLLLLQFFLIERHRFSTAFSPCFHFLLSCSSLPLPWISFPLTHTCNIKRMSKMTKRVSLPTSLLKKRLHKLEETISLDPDPQATGGCVHSFSSVCKRMHAKTVKQL